MQAKSVFLQGFEALQKLDQSALNAWFKNLFKYGDDTFFRSYLLCRRDDYPSMATNELFKACTKYNDPELKQRLIIAVENLLQNCLELEPGLAYDLLLTIIDNKITEAVNTMIEMIKSGKFREIIYQDTPLQFAFLKFLATLHQHGQPGSHEADLDRKIVETLQAYLNDPVYTEVCQNGLDQITEK